MKGEIDATHAPERVSWVTSANGHSDFPLQNLPLCIFRLPGGSPRTGAAIGDEVLDIAAALSADLLSDGAGDAARAASGSELNSFFAAGRSERQALRVGLVDLLDAANPRRETALAFRESILYSQEKCVFERPARIGGYTDFYAGIHHATNSGRLMRPDNPLLPNYKYVPIGYNGRASSIGVSGNLVRRPSGQRKNTRQEAPDFGPSTKLDYELEIGIWIGCGNQLGVPIAIDSAHDTIAGFSLLNDWSARDIQAWEYQPLGPFLAKSFATTLSPWVVTPEALAPFRVAQGPRPKEDPPPLDYLADGNDQACGALDIDLEAFIVTRTMRQHGSAPYLLSTSNSRHLYWTVAQLVAHHTCGGCNLEPGDLLGTGTISGPSEGSYGSLLESTRGGSRSVDLQNGESRTFLEDGDTIIMRGHCHREGYVSIGFGDCWATVQPAI